MSRNDRIGGVACPGCGHRGSDVMDSRPVGTGRTRRRRRCTTCRDRFTTVELVVVDDMPEAEDLLDLRPLPKLLRHVVETVYDGCIAAAGR